MATMLSRTLRRAVLDTRTQLPPTFLLPWTAGLTTVSHASEASNVNIPPPNAGASISNAQSTPVSSPASISPDSMPLLPPSSDSPSTTPLELSPSVRELLPLLRAQGPHYMTALIHQKPYLLTQGDTVRLPFRMRDVEPGDILRLNRALNLGSRDYTLKAAAAAPKLRSSTMDTTNILDPTTGNLASHSRVMPTEGLSGAATQRVQHAPHFIPHIAQGKVPFLDDRLFICRAVVMGVESEPMRYKEKTKRRQRKVKTVKSKHRFTVLKIKELRVRSAEEIDQGDVE